MFYTPQDSGVVTADKKEKAPNKIERRGIVSLFESPDSVEFKQEMEHRGLWETWSKRKGSMGNFEPYHQGTVLNQYFQTTGAPNWMIRSGQAKNAFAAFHKLDPKDTAGMVAKAKEEAGRIHQREKVYTGSFNQGVIAYLAGGEMAEGIFQELGMFEPDDKSMPKTSARAIVRRGFNQGLDAARRDFAGMEKPVRDALAIIRETGQQPDTTTGGETDMDGLISWYSNASGADKHKWRQAVRLLASQEEIQELGYLEKVNQRMGRSVGKFLDTFGSFTGHAMESFSDLIGSHEGAKNERKRQSYHQLRLDMWRMLDEDVVPLYDHKKAGSFRKGMEAAYESIPFWAMYLYSPAAGLVGGAVYEGERTYNELRQKYPGVHDSDLRAVSNVVGPVNSAIELVSFRMLSTWAKGTFPGLAKLQSEAAKRGGYSAVLQDLGMRGVSARVAREGGRFGWLYGRELATETVQDMTTPLMQQVVGAFPEFDLKAEMGKVWEETPVRAWAVLPFTLLGGAGQAYVNRADYKGVRDLFTDREAMRESGLNAEAIDQVAREARTDPEGALLTFRRAWEATPEDVRQQNRDGLQRDRSREIAQEEGRPVVLEAQGGYEVFLPDGPVERAESLQEVEDIVLPWAVQDGAQSIPGLVEGLEEFAPETMEALTMELAKARDLGGIEESVTITSEDLTPAGQSPALVAAQKVLQRVQGGSGQGRPVARNWLGTTEGKAQAVIELAKGRANPFYLVREGAQTFLKQEVSRGTASMEWIRENLVDIGERTGRPLIQDGDGDVEVLEAFSDVAVAVATGHTGTNTLPSRFIAWIRSFLRAMGELFALARQVRELSEKGEISPDFEQFAQRAAGLTVEEVSEALEASELERVGAEIEQALEENFMAETFSVEDQVPLAAIIQQRIKQAGPEIIPFLQKAKERVVEIGEGYLARDDGSGDLDLRTALAYLGAIQRALPEDARKYVGTFQSLANLTSIEAMEREIARRLPRVEAGLERVLVRALHKEVRKEMDKSLPQTDKKTRRSAPKLDVIGSAIAEKAVEAMTMDPQVAIDQAAVLREQADRSEEMEVEDQEIAYGQALALELFADYDAADSARLRGMVDFLKTNHEEGRRNRMETLKKRKEEKEDRIASVLSAINAPEFQDYAFTARGGREKNRWKAMGRELQSFYDLTDSLVETADPADRAKVEEFAKEIRRAAYEFEDRAFDAREKLEKEIERIWGIKGPKIYREAATSAVLREISQREKGLPLRDS